MMTEDDRPPGVTYSQLDLKLRYECASKVDSQAQAISAEGTLAVDMLCIKFLARVICPNSS